MPTPFYPPWPRFQQVPLSISFSRVKRRRAIRAGSRHISNRPIRRTLWRNPCPRPHSHPYPHCSLRSITPPYPRLQYRAPRAPRRPLRMRLCSRPIRPARLKRAVIGCLKMPTTKSLAEVQGLGQNHLACQRSEGQVCMQMNVRQKAGRWVLAVQVWRLGRLGLRGCKLGRRASRVLEVLADRAA